MGPYKLDPPKLKALKLDAVEKFKKGFSEAFAHDPKLRAFPLIEQGVIDHLEIEQQVSPVEIKPATPGGSVGRVALVWPTDYEKTENNNHLFDFLTEHATPGDDSESEAMLRQVKCPSRGLQSLQLTDVTTPLATFQRRAKTLQVADDTATSIFIHSFLATQPQLATQVEDSKPASTRDAIKTLVERLKALDQARSLVQSLDLQITARKPHRDQANNGNGKNTDAPSGRQPCLGCGGNHHTKNCRKGPWRYNADYTIYHGKDDTMKPTTPVVPKNLRASVDRHLKNLAEKKTNTAKKGGNDKNTSPYADVPCYPAILSLQHSDEHKFSEQLFWDNGLSHSLLEASTYDYFVQEYGAEENILEEDIVLNTWGKPLHIQRSIVLDVTIQPPHVVAEVTASVEFYRGGENVGSGISNMVLGSLGLHARLQQIADQRMAVGEPNNSARRATVALPCAAPEDNAPQDDVVFTESVETDVNDVDDEMPKVYNDNEAGDLRKVLRKHRKRFPKKLPKKPAKIRPFRIIMIDVNQKLPYRRPRRYSNERRREIRKQVTKMIKEGIIDPSKSPIASTVVLARKADNTWRFCVDYRAINENTQPDAEPLPRMDDIIENLRGRKYFAIFDLRAGYHQIEVHPDSRKYSAFVTDDGLYEFVRLPFGFRNAPGYFMRQIRLILAGHLHRICEAYLDDIVVWGATIEELAKNIDEVLTRLAEFNIVLKAKKCAVGQSEIRYLGHLISAEGIRPDPARVEAIASMPPPTSASGVRSFLGVCQFVRAFVNDFARLAAPLTSLLKKGVTFSWGEEQEAAFQILKSKLSDADSLAHFDPALPTQVRCDASLLGVGGVLLQQHGDELKPVAYTSKTFNARERNWTTIEQECFGIVHCVNAWRHYLAGHPFEILTDHRNLTFLTSCTTPKVQRWATMLLEHHFSVRHLPGHLNQTADHLSRHPIRAANHARMAFTRRQTRDRGDTSIPQHGPSTPPHDDLPPNTQQHKTTSGSSTPENIIDIIAQAHNAVIGHGGVHRTIRTLDRWGINWPTRRADVVSFVRSCATCQAADGRAPSVPLAPDGTVIRHEPFSRYAIDLAGPYPISDGGHRYILIAIDSATRFVELVALRDKTAFSIADGLLSLFGRYGCPEEIHSDRGSEFVNGIVDALMEALNISRSTSIPYRPATNGQVERHVKEVTRHLRDVVFEDKVFRARWCRAIAIVQRILNATVLNPSADVCDYVTPVQLLFADRVTPDRKLIKNKNTATRSSPLPLEAADYVAQLRDVQDHILNHMPSPVSDVPSFAPLFDVGTHVLLAPASRPPDKLSPKLTGPYVVASVRRNLVTITDLQSGKQRDVHASRLRRWTRRAGADPADAAADASSDYVVDAVVGHKRRPNARGRLSKEKCLFLVRWEDFPDLADHTYQSYASLKHTHALTDYLNSVNLA